VLSNLPTYQPHHSVVLVRPSPHYRRNWSGYRHRPAEARRLLEQAGCRSGADGIYVCAGQRLSLRFVTSAGIPPRAQTISLAQAQLRQVGVEVVPIYAPPPVFLDQILPQGGFDVALFGWASDPTGTGSDEVFGCGGALNFTGYCQRLVTRDLDQANRILDARRQARVLNRADRQMAQDVPALPLFQIPLPAAYRTTINNYELSYNPLTTSDAWWLER
jgi:peptide/nickel transport system substrate-binding protein